MRESELIEADLITCLKVNEVMLDPPPIKVFADSDRAIEKEGVIDTERFAD
jgi:hypothetical protein